MRIAMLIEAWEPIWGGGQAHVLELSKKLAENHQCEVDIFTMNFLDENGKIQSKIEELGDGKIKIIRTGKIRNFSFIGRIIWIFEAISTVKNYHKEKKYNLIHAHANLPGIPGKILSILLNIPVVFTIHGSGVESIYDMYGKNLKSFFFAKMEKFLQCGIRYNEEISVDRQILAKNNCNKKVSIIPNGVDIDKFDGISEIKSKIFKIIFVGRLHPQKGLDFFLEAINKIKSDLFDKCEVHIIGNGELEAQLREKTKNYAIENIVKFRGRISGNNLIKEYKSSHLFVLPSLFEGQPLTLLEAWAAHLTVLVTDVGDNRFFVENGANGYIAPPKDSGALAEIILVALANPDLEIMGENGYNLVKEKYSWDNVAEKTYGIYLEIC